MTGIGPSVVGGIGAALLVAGLLRPGPRLGPARRRSPLPGAVTARLSARLHRAGLHVAPLAALGAVAGASVTSALLAWVLRGSVPLTVLAAAAPVVAATAVVGGRCARHPDRVADTLPGVIRATADGLGAGRSLRHALARAAADAPQPARGELAVLVDHLETGGRLDDALDDLARRCPRPAVQLMCAAILVSAASGGNLARVLGDLAGRLERRRLLDRELRGLGAQSRMTAWLVGSLPMLGAVAVEAAAPGLLGRTLGHGAGLVSLVVSVCLMGVAVALVRHLGSAV